MLTVALLWSGLAAAQVHIENTDPGNLGDDWVAKLQSHDPSTDNFYQFLGNGILEQSFTLRHQSTVASAALPGPSGLHIGLDLATFPFAPPQVNYVGKTENTKFSPVLPRLDVGWTEQEQRLGYGVGFSLTPPLTIKGASALVFGVDGTIGYNLGEKWRIGGEADLTLGRVKAPVTASEEQAANGELDENTDPERVEEVCMTQEWGCTDVLSLSHTSLRLVGTWRLSEDVHPYVKVGADYISDTLLVQVDLSSWRLYGVLPDAGLGVSLLPGQRWRGLVGVSGAISPEAVTTSGRTPLVYRIDGALAYTF